MKTFLKSTGNDLLQEAHMVAAEAFELDGRSCQSISSPSGAGPTEGLPLGFLVTHGEDIKYLDIHTPEGGQILEAWKKYRLLEFAREACTMPSEYWYG